MGPSHSSTTRATHDMATVQLPHHVNIVCEDLAQPAVQHDASLCTDVTCQTLRHSGGLGRRAGPARRPETRTQALRNYTEGGADESKSETRWRYCGVATGYSVITLGSQVVVWLASIASARALLRSAQPNHRMSHQREVESARKLQRL